MSHHNTFKPEPLPRDDVEVIYNLIAAAPSPPMLEDIAAQVPQYNLNQVYWACGTLATQGIISMAPTLRSDRRACESGFDVLQPFAGYVGWESAK